MQALILAAGFGKRLRPLTDTMPKALVPVRGTPLLLHSLDCLAKIDEIDEVVLVVGHRKQDIMAAVGAEYRGMRIVYVENPRYETTNNVFSLALAQPYIHEDCLMLECDIYYGDTLLQALRNGGGDCSILVSPFDARTMNGSVVFADEADRAKALVIKRDQGEGFDYAGALKTVNAYRFTQSFLRDVLMPNLETYVQTQGVNSYYELVIGGLIYYGNCDIRVVRLPATEWYEIDDADDLAIAEAAQTL